MSVFSIRGGEPNQEAVAHAISAKVRGILDRSLEVDGDFIKYAIPAEEMREIVTRRMMGDYPVDSAYWDYVYVHNSFIDDDSEWYPDFQAPFLIILDDAASESDSRDVIVSMDLYGNRLDQQSLDIAVLLTDFTRVSSMR